MYSVIFFILGLIFGSFMNVLICRLPYGKSIVSPGSSCQTCGHKIRFYENIPLLSYIFLRGRCSGCKTKISFQYPFVEFVTGVAFLIAYRYFGISLLTLKMIIFLYMLLVIAFTDFFTSLDSDNFECGVIPVVLTRGGMILGIILSLLVAPGIKTFLNSVIGLLVGGLTIWLPGFIYEVITKKEGMGFGDVELLAMVGSFLGYKPILFILMLSSLLGIIVGIPVILIKKNRNFPLPFGPFISLATIVYIFYGDTLISLYLNTIYGG